MGYFPRKGSWVRVLPQRVPEKIKLTYQSSDTGTAKTVNFPADVFEVKLWEGDVVPNTISFDFAGESYWDKGGKLYWKMDASTGIGLEAGTVDYVGNSLSITDYTVGVEPRFVLKSALTKMGDKTITNAVFAAPNAPLKAGSVTVQCEDIDGNIIVAQTDQAGQFQDSKIQGSVDHQLGIIRTAFAEWVSVEGNESEPWYDASKVVGGQIFKPVEIKPSTIKFNFVSFSHIPLEASVLGINPIRLPTDGRVPFIRKGTNVVIHYGDETTFANPANAGDQLDVSQTLLSSAVITDDNGVEVAGTEYEVNLDAGVVAINNNADLSAYTQPLKVEWRIEDMVLVANATIDNKLKLTKPLSHNYSALAGTKVSSALISGDMKARYSNLFDEESWTGDFSREQINNSNASYDDVNHPLILTNKGTIQEQWAMVFTSTHDFKCIGKYVGEIGYGNTSTDFAPINPNNGLPYFILKKDGWGNGWSVNMALVFESIAANHPIWIARTVLQSNSTIQSDKFKIHVRGDENQP